MVMLQNANHVPEQGRKAIAPRPRRLCRLLLWQIFIIIILRKAIIVLNNKCLYSTGLTNEEEARYYTLHERLQE